MKKFFLLTVTLLVLSAISSTAQTLPRGQYPAGTLKVTVPFDFVVGDIHLTGGEYMFFIDTTAAMLHIRNVVTGKQVMVFTRDILSSDPLPANKLIFMQDGHQNILHRVWSTQAGHVHDIVHGEGLKEL